MKRIWIAGLMTLLAAPMVSAHTVAIGTVNAGSPGSVTLWMGSYHNPAQAPATEGAMALIAGPVTTGPVAFTTLVGALPAGLIAGSNYFYAPGTFGSGAPAGTYDRPTWTGSASLLPQRWQGVTFTGLAAGTYTYQLSGMNTAIYANWNTGTNNWTGTLVIPRSSVSVPEPGTLALLGIGMLGIGLARRRRQA